MSRHARHQHEHPPSDVIPADLVASAALAGDRPDPRLAALARLLAKLAARDALTSTTATQAPTQTPSRP